MRWKGWLLLSVSLSEQDDVGSIVETSPGRAAPVAVDEEVVIRQTAPPLGTADRAGFR